MANAQRGRALPTRRRIEIHGQARAIFKSRPSRPNHRDTSIHNEHKSMAMDKRTSREALGGSKAFGVVPVEEVEEGARASSNSGSLLDVVVGWPSHLRHHDTNNNVNNHSNALASSSTSVKFFLARIDRSQFTFAFPPCEPLP